MRFAGRIGAYVRDMLLPAVPEERNLQKYRNAAWLRFCFVIPLLYGFTLYTMLRAWHTGALSPACKSAVAAWIALAALNVALNAAVLFVRNVRACEALSLLCIADELSSNEIVVYLTGVAASHALLFILIAVAAYRVYFDYRQGLFSAAFGVGIHVTAVALYLGGALPDPPVRYAAMVGITPPDLAWASTLALIIGVLIALAAINLGMNKLHRMRKEIAENWKRDLDSIERFAEQMQGCADEGLIYAETLKALLYATPFRAAALLEQGSSGFRALASSLWPQGACADMWEGARFVPPAGNEMTKVVCRDPGGRPAYCLRLECDRGTPVFLAVLAEDGREPDGHRKSMLLNIAQSAGGALAALRMLKEEKERGYRDGLTGLYNKSFLLERMPAIVKDAGESGLPLCIAMFDIDDFKSYNDTFGHLAGDELLRQVAHALADALRAGDTALRFGGEEFLAVLAGCDRESGAAVAERFRAAVERIRDPNRPVTVSGGVAAYPADAADGAALVACADGRLYAAKKTGKNRICIS